MTWNRSTLFEDMLYSCKWRSRYSELGESYQRLIAGEKGENTIFGAFFWKQNKGGDGNMEVIYFNHLF